MNMENMNAFPNIGNVSGAVKKCLFWTISGETGSEEKSITGRTLTNEPSVKAHHDKISQLWQSLTEKRLRTSRMLNAVKMEARKQSKDMAVWKESRATLISLSRRLKGIGNALKELKRWRGYVDDLKGMATVLFFV